MTAVRRREAATHATVAELRLNQHVFVGAGLQALVVLPRLILRKLHRSHLIVDLVCKFTLVVIGYVQSRMLE